MCHMFFVGQYSAFFLFQGLSGFMLSQQWNQLYCWLCHLLHTGFHVIRTECAHFRSRRIR